MKVFETGRLELRWFNADDAAFILELLNEPGWLRFIGDKQVDTLEAARKYLETVPIESYEKNGYGLFAVELKDTNTLIGMCGLVNREGLDDIDIGFALLARYEGQGYAREAASATLDYAREGLSLSRVVAITTPDNRRSAAVLERIGMVCERTIRLPGSSEDLELYAISF